MLELLEEHIPYIRDTIKLKILPEINGHGNDWVENEKQLRTILIRAYGVLPFSVKLVVGQEKFVWFCLTQQSKIFPDVKIKIPVKKKVSKSTSNKKINRKTKK